MNPIIEDDLLSGQIWNEYCDALKQAGQQVLRAETPANAFDRAEGWRFLSRLTRVGLEMFVEAGTPEFPTFMVPSHETAKIGADNPDMGYLAARISGRYRYRVRGQRGTVASINFSTKRGGYEQGGTLLPGGFIDTNTLLIDPDGNFEIILSGEPTAGNWLECPPDTVQLLVRQVFRNRRTETPAQISIECLDTAGQTPPPLDPAALHGNLRRAASFVENTARMLGDWTQKRIRHFVNRSAAIPTSFTTTRTGLWPTTRPCCLNSTAYPHASTGMFRSTTTGWSHSTTAISKSA